MKCRQWGGSTLTDIYMAWLQIFWKTNWNSNIVGHQSSSATQVFDMYEKLINAIPTWLFYDIGVPFKNDPRKIKTSGTIQNIKYLIPRDCKIQTGSARNPESCRSGDAALAHITEEAFFPNTTEWTPAKVIKAASSSIQPDPLTFIVRESTPNGRENEFHDAWVAANSVDKDGKPLSAFTPVFVAWFEIENIYCHLLPRMNVPISPSGCGRIAMTSKVMVSTIGGSMNVKAHLSRASIGILRSPRSMRLLTICVRSSLLMM